MAALSEVPDGDTSHNAHVSHPHHVVRAHKLCAWSHKHGHTQEGVRSCVALKVTYITTDPLLWCVSNE